ncbi:hypothetical protein GCM10010306_032550 [Streptomyces umbrinus]|nr:hypothetical protein GCM10010306_032550 [Streptomyces umbrinus]
MQPARMRSPPLETPRTSRSTTRCPWRPVTWSVQVSVINGLLSWAVMGLLGNGDLGNGDLGTGNWELGTEDWD